MIQALETAEAKAMNQEDTGFFEKHKEIVIVEPK
jgi:hypothetical protein